MEITILLIIMGGAFLAFLSTRSRRGKTEHSQYVAPPAERPVTTSTTATFEQKTARRLEARKILKGRAFIVDGDTITIRKTQIRLFGVDAPELDHPYGIKAKWALHALCKDQIVEAEIIEEDAHGRTVALCKLPDGRDLSAEMVKQGLAIDWPKFSNGVYRPLETPDARKKLFLADARQQGRMHVWEQYEKRKTSV